jgi:hypothetical protein
MVGLCRAVCPSVVVSNKKCKINPRSIYLLNTCKNRSGPCRPPAERDRKNRIAHGGDTWRHSARSSVLDYAGNSETGNLDRIYRIRDTKAMFLVFPVFDPSQIRVHLCPPAERDRKNRIAHGGDTWRHSARSSVLDYAGNSETGNLDWIYRIRDTRVMFFVFPVFDPSRIRVHLCPPTVLAPIAAGPWLILNFSLVF